MGQQLVNSFNVKVGLEKIEAAFPGDPEIARQVTRVRLCLQGDGWRGIVEDLMDYDENGRPTTDLSGKKKSKKILSPEESVATSLPPPSAESVDLPPVDMSVSVVEVPGKMNDVSMLSTGGAEDQRHRK